MSPGKRAGFASLPLHGGKAPDWLCSRMVVSDPFWFQAFGRVPGFEGVR